MTPDDARRRAGSRLWIGIPGPMVDAPTRALLTELRPGGIVLFGRNIENRAQVAALIGELRAVCGAALHVAVDQEGGRVVRFTSELTLFPGNAALGAIARRDLAGAVALAERQGFASGTELRAIGIDVNLAPCVDLAPHVENPGIGDRSFGADADAAAALAAALVRGHRRAGVHSTLKHFPGLGAARIDSHFELPIVTEPVTQRQLAPFRAGIRAGAGLVMTSHARYTAIDADRPATLSPHVIELLRGRLKFRGLIISDDLEMGAIVRHSSFAEVVHGTLAAGHNALCVSTDPELQRVAHASAMKWFAKLDDTQAARSDIQLERLQAEPDHAADGADIARKIAESACAVLRDPERVVPIAADARVLLLLPTLKSATLVEDPLRGETLEALAAGFGPRARSLAYPTEPQPEDFARLATAAAASDVDVLLVAVFRARFSPQRLDLVRQCVEWHPRVVFLLLGEDGDIVALPTRRPNAVVGAYGFRPVHQLAAVKRLTT
ncbi:MAG: beta-N-acetylhexosaminidase [Planctomycetota bacterium]